MKHLITLLIGLGLLIIVGKAVYKHYESVPVPMTSISSQPNVTVMINTTEGPIKVELDFQNTAMTSQNFLNYAQEGYYNGTLFHRVIDGFMIQGGGFLPGMQEKAPSAAPIKNEGGKCDKNKRGTIAMARTSDPHSATSQFFINVVDNTALDFTSESMQGWGYCAFGHVVEGMEVVDKIKSVPTTTSGPFQDVPVKDVLINSVEVVKN